MSIVNSVIIMLAKLNFLDGISISDLHSMYVVSVFRARMCKRFRGRVCSRFRGRDTVLPGSWIYLQSVDFFFFF